MSALTQLPNIGKVLEKLLLSVNIETPQQLCSVGAQEAFLRIRQVDSTACFSMLCALQGAIANVRWHHLPPQTKNDLRTFFKAL